MSAQKQPAKDPSAMRARRAAAELSARRDTEAAAAVLPVEQRSLVARLSDEVAALRKALDLSHHRIATLEAEAAEDPVSGLLNRRAFTRELERAIAFHLRYGMGCAVVFLDLDDFKPINDRFGHRMGDLVLRRVGHALRAGIRSSDVVARVGGDEFGAVLWNCGAEDAERRATRLAADIAALDLVLGDETIRITASLGLTAIAAGDSAETVLDRADRLMYRAKGARSAEVQNPF